MAGSTSKGFPYPSNGDSVNVPGDIQALADALNSFLPAVPVGTTDTQTLTNKTLTDPKIVAAVNTQTSNYVLILTDNGKIVEMNLAGANTLTVPPNSSVAFPVGTQIVVVQYGAGQTTLTPGAGVTIRSNGSKLKLNGQYAMAALYKRATDEWVASGNLSV